MRSMTDREASRDFRALLDIVERGESVQVTRDGQPVATCIPVRKVRIADPGKD